MIMPIALARDGFIDRKLSVSFESTDDFLSALNKVFIFVDKDLQNFDGNSFIIENDDNPTNSIFIYSNDTGTFLYQIQTAVPFLHMNKMLWECTCYKMESIETLNNLLESNEFGLVDNVFLKEFKTLYLGNSINEIDPYITPTIKIKDNFEAVSKIIEKIRITDVSENEFVFLKIKFMVDPSENQVYKTVNEASDGSFSFLFVVSKTPDNKITTKMRLGTTENYVNLIDLISKYSENIKSIEILPFEPTISKDGTLFTYQKNINVDYVTISNVQNPSVFDNKLGIFYATGESCLFTNYLLQNSNEKYFNPTFTHGGGSRGFLKTPLGNFILDFNTNPSDFSQNWLYYKIKTDGISIDGIFKCEIAPHFLNFYTDNAGQVFIQNMTTNAQELRQINREYVNTATNAQSSAIAQTMSEMLTNSTSILSGSIFGSLASFGANKIQYENTKQQNKNNYELAKANYEDKIKTQNLLSKYEGKQISGNLSISDFFSKNNCFELNIEFNYICKTQDNNYIYLSQKDYDYSCENANNYNNVNSLSEEKTSLLYKIFFNSILYNINVSRVIQLERSKNFQNNEFAFKSIYSKILVFNIRLPQKIL